MGAPVDHTCGSIDDAISILQEIRDQLETFYEKNEKNSIVLSCKKLAEQIENNCDKVEGMLEDLRNDNSDLRGWGEELECEKEELESEIITLKEENEMLQREIDEMVSK